MQPRRYRVEQSVCLALLLVGCGSGEPTEAPRMPATPSAPTPQQPLTGERDDDQQAAIEALEALGYAGGTVAADPARATGVTRHDAARAQPGLNLLVSAHDSEVLLMDMQGETLHRWACEFSSLWPDRGGVGKWRSDESFRRVRLLAGGELLAIWEGLGLVKLDRDSNVLWSFGGNAHHDLDVDAEGRIYVLTRKAAVLPRFNEDQAILEDFVTVLSPAGVELRSVSLLECFEGAGFDEAMRFVDQAGDVFHTNTLSLLDGAHAATLPEFTAGRVLLSLRRPGTLAVCDLEARTAVWALQGDWRLQHEPVMLSDGHLLLFDNRGKRRRSGVLELDPATGEVLWEYRRAEPDAFYSASCGTAHRLANGNTLVSETEAGRAFEITRAGEVVWQYDSPFRWREGDEEFVASVFDMVRVPVAFVEDWLER